MCNWKLATSLRVCAMDCYLVFASQSNGLKWSRGKATQYLPKWIVPDRADAPGPELFAWGVDPTLRNLQSMLYHCVRNARRLGSSTQYSKFVANKLVYEISVYTSKANEKYFFMFFNLSLNTSNFWHFI